MFQLSFRCPAIFYLQNQVVAETSLVSLLSILSSIFWLSGELQTSVTAKRVSSRWCSVLKCAHWEHVYRRCEGKLGHQNQANNLTTYRLILSVLPQPSLSHGETVYLFVIVLSKVRRHPAVHNIATVRQRWGIRRYVLS